MIIAFVIWSMVSLLFFMISLSTWRAKREVGFFNGVKPPKMKNAIAYNHAVAKLWFVFGIIFEILGIPLLFIEQNSPIVFLIVIGVILLIIGTIIVYLRIEQKHRA